MRWCTLVRLVHVGRRPRTRVSSCIANWLAHITLVVYGKVMAEFNISYGKTFEENLRSFRSFLFTDCGDHLHRACICRVCCANPQDRRVRVKHYETRASWRHFNLRKAKAHPRDASGALATVLISKDAAIREWDEENRNKQIFQTAARQGPTPSPGPPSPRVPPSPMAGGELASKGSHGN